LIRKRLVFFAEFELPLPKKKLEEEIFAKRIAEFAAEHACLAVEPETGVWLLFQENIPFAVFFSGEKKPLYDNFADCALFVKQGFVTAEIRGERRKQKISARCPFPDALEKIIRDFKPTVTETKEESLRRFLTLLTANEAEKAAFFCRLVLLLSDFGKKISEKDRLYVEKNLPKNPLVALLEEHVLEICRDIRDGSPASAYLRLFRVFFEESSELSAKMCRYVLRQSEDILAKKFGAEEGLTDRFSLSFCFENLKTGDFPLLLLSRFAEKIPVYNPKFKATVQKLFLQKSAFFFDNFPAFIVALIETALFLKSNGIHLALSELPLFFGKRKKNPDFEAKINFFCSAELPETLPENGNYLCVYIGENECFRSEKHRDSRKRIADECDFLFLADFGGKEKRLLFGADGEEDERIFANAGGFGIGFFGKSQHRLDKDFRYVERVGSAECKANFFAEFAPFEHAVSFRVEEPNAIFEYFPNRAAKIFERWTDLRDIFKKIIVRNQLPNPPYLLRPFEYEGFFLSEARENFLLTVPRIAGQNFRHVLVSKAEAAPKIFQRHFPLWIIPESISSESDFGLFGEAGEQFSPNLRPESKKIFANFFDSRTDMKAVFAYVYAVLNAPLYAETFSYFLRETSPRVPLRIEKTAFQKIASLGARLTDLHFLRNVPEAEHIRFKSVKNTTIKRFRYESGRIYLSDKFFIEGISEEMFAYRMGNYRVLENFFEGKKALSHNDMAHFEQICRSVFHTLRLLPELDEALKPLLS
jgi:hypothetical protein